jgi:hypothetical protein
MNTSSVREVTETAVASLRSDLARSGSTRRERLAMKFLMAAIGSLPWVGGLLSAAAAIPGDEKDVRADDLRTKWLEEHESKLANLRGTLDHIADRFESLGPAIDERIQSSEYLAIVRQSFRAWDKAETSEKRQYVANLLTNAAGTSLCSDDVLRLFVNWLDLYHEAHFSVIRQIFKEGGGITRYEIWSRLYGEPPREDSAEADLFRLLIRDLSTGGVIRQPRDTNEQGQFMRRRMGRRSRIASSTLESAFEDTKPYVLTELGRQFVHYTMNDVVARVESGHAEQGVTVGGEDGSGEEARPI